MEKTELMQVVKLLDKIISSNNAEIKDAFRELLIVAALTETTNDDTPGILTSLIFSEMDNLRKEVKSIHQELAYHSNRAGKSYYDEYRRYAAVGGRGYNDPYSGVTATSMTTDDTQKIDWAGIMKTYKSKKI